MTFYDSICIKGLYNVDKAKCSHPNNPSFVTWTLKQQVTTMAAETKDGGLTDSSPSTGRSLAVGTKKSHFYSVPLLVGSKHRSAWTDKAKEGLRLTLHKVLDPQCPLEEWYPQQPLGVQALVQKYMSALRLIEVVFLFLSIFHPCPQM